MIGFGSLFGKGNPPLTDDSTPAPLPTPTPPPAPSAPAPADMPSSGPAFDVTPSSNAPEPMAPSDTSAPVAPVTPLPDTDDEPVKEVPIENKGDAGVGGFIESAPSESTEEPTSDIENSFENERSEGAKTELDDAPSDDFSFTNSTAEGLLPAAEPASEKEEEAKPENDSPAIDIATGLDDSPEEKEETPDQAEVPDMPTQPSDPEAGSFPATVTQQVEALLRENVESEQKAITDEENALNQHHQDLERQKEELENKKKQVEQEENSVKEQEASLANRRDNLNARKDRIEKIVNDLQ